MKAAVTQLSLAAQLEASLDMLVAAQDACVLVAIDPKAMDEWCEATDDATLFRLFEWYMERFKVGEAMASLNS